MDQLKTRAATPSLTCVAARVFASVVVLGVLSTALPTQEAPKPESSPPRWRMRGCAVDEEGHPIAGAAIAIGGEGLTTADALANPCARSAADGCFEIEFAEPEHEEPRILLGDKGRISVRLFRESLLFEGRGPERLIELGPILLPRAITVRGTVRNKAGDPIQGARVVATDLLEGVSQPGWFRRRLEHVSFGITDSKGMVVLPGIAATGARISVRADGYYEQEIPVLSQGDPLIVELQAGGFVEGVVLGADGKPCSAHVYVRYEVDGGSGEPGLWCADGKFRINLRHPHRYRVHASYGRAGSESISEVLDGAARGVEARPVRKEPERDAGLTLNVLDAGSGSVVEQVVAPRGLSFSGHLIGGKVPAGSHLVLRLPRGARPASSVEGPHSYEGFVDAGGGFTLHGVVPGESDVDLVVPHRQGRGGWISVPIETVHIAQSVDTQKDLDIGGVIVGSIRGVVKFSGASCVREHLMVKADRYWDAVAEPVANDWTFRIPAAPGPHRLQVVDLTTGVALAISEPVLVEGATPVDVELRQDLARVRVRLEPADPGEPIVAANLEIAIDHRVPEWADGRNDPFLLCGDGVSLADGKREVELLLPTARTRLRVRSNAGEVLGELSWLDEEPLGELQLRPEAGDTETVVIKVRAPTKKGQDKK